MVGFVENVSGKAKVTIGHERSPAIDEECSEKTSVNAQK